MLQRIEGRISAPLQVSERESYFETVLDLNERSEGNVEKSPKFVTPFTRRALYDIGGTRKGGTPEL